MGGADQWGNITAGLELIRRTAGAGEDDDRAGPRARLQAPAVAVGTKFGKSETGDSVWLDAARTTPFDVLPVLAATPTTATSGTYLRWFTELSARGDRGAGRGRRASARGARGPAGAGLDITARTHGAAAAEGRARLRGDVRARLDRGPGGPAPRSTPRRGVRLRCGDAGSRNGHAPGGRRLVRLQGGGPAVVAGGGVTINGDAGDGRRGRPGADRRGVARGRIGKRRRGIGRRTD